MLLGVLLAQERLNGRLQGFHFGDLTIDTTLGSPQHGLALIEFMSLAFQLRAPF
ncbi:unnamed protein product [Pararhodospirillum photometricum DSM 122]|uniref:Uncharacterized protein n=1 Tax=Pararhodospirillum photometricum DSM 122 TaxID=1150469 RepID=H6SMF0_PARPM|nr:unnamed protein product [Pararhodospirillum photometricum DSM 122]